ncbi:MAG: ABC transporter ATP-binding protein [Alphaproteobacteria bacterium]
MTMQPLLQVTDLVVSAREAAVVDHVSFALMPGEIMALVGESGSGKTMAARSVVDLLPPGVRRTGGRIVFDGRDLTALPSAAMRALRGPGIGMVFQEPMVSLNPALTIGAQLAEGLELHRKLPKEEVLRLCREMLARVQITDPDRCLAAYPHEFSGGMRQRIMLAAVMLLKPKLLLADEPTTALDTLTQREVLDLMVDLTRDNGTAVILITHNLGLVARYAARAVVMERGKVVEAGTARDILLNPQQPYTRTLVGALPRRGAARPVPPDAAPIVSVRDLEVVFPGRRRMFRAAPPVHAVKGVSLDVRPGEVLAVVGGSGSGKTTLGRAILGLVPAKAGIIRFAGTDIAASDAAAMRRFRLACQLVFQDPYSSLDPRMRVGPIVAEPLRHATDLDGRAKERRVAEVLEEVGLAGFAQRHPHELSGGQRQRVAIARALVRRPAFVVADEPVSALDMTIQQQVLTLFQRLQAQHGFACLFISHDLAAVAQIADRVAVMQTGLVVEEGTRDEIFDRPQHPYTRELLDASPRIEDLAA